MLQLLPETHFPAFLEKNKQSFLFLCSQFGQRFLSPRGSAWARTWGRDLLAMDPSCLAAVPFPMCHPSLAAWELKISEMQGITGCLNISLL